MLGLKFETPSPELGFFAPIACLNYKLCYFHFGIAPYGLPDEAAGLAIARHGVFLPKGFEYTSSPLTSAAPSACLLSFVLKTFLFC